MNKNIIWAVLGLGVFVLFAVLLWDKGEKDEEPRFRPGPAPEPATKTKAPTPAPEKPDESPAETDGTKAPDKPEPPEGVERPGSGDPAEGEEATKPEEGGEQVEKPPAETAEEPEGEPIGKTRITSDPKAVDEEARVEAAGGQELPAKWLDKDKDVKTEKKKAFPDSYVLPKTMSLYRVAEIVYGDADKWQLLFQANKAILEDPEKVKAGTELKVPDPSLPAAPSGGKKKSRLSDGVF